MSVKFDKLSFGVLPGVEEILGLHTFVHRVGSAGRCFGKSICR